MPLSACCDTYLLPSSLHDWTTQQVDVDSSAVMPEAQIRSTKEVERSCTCVSTDAVVKSMEQQKPKKHKRFYMPEGDIIIQVRSISYLFFQYVLI